MDRSLKTPPTDTTPTDPSLKPPPDSPPPPTGAPEQTPTEASPPSATDPADPLALFELLRADASDDDIRHASRAMLDPVIASYPFAQGYRLLIFYDERPILRVDADRIYRALNELPAGTPHRGRRAR